MLNKNDPLIAAVQKVMQSNQAERDAVAAVNEKFGVVDRRALPRERQHEWDSAYQSILTEGLHPNQQKLDVHEPEKDELTKKDFEMLRAKKKKPMEEEKKMKGDDPCWKGYEMIGMKNKGGKEVPNCVPVKEEGDPSKAIRGDVVTGGSSVSSVAPKEKSVTPSDQSALRKKIQSVIKEASEKQKNKVGKVMREFKKGSLHSGKGGPVVTNKKQAVAIALSQAGLSKAKKKLEEAGGPVPAVVKKQQADAAAAKAAAPANSTSRSVSAQPGILDRIKTNIGMGSSASQVKPSGMSGNYPRSAQTTRRMDQETKNAGEKAVARIQSAKASSAARTDSAPAPQAGAAKLAAQKAARDQSSKMGGGGTMGAKTPVPVPKAKPSVPGKAPVKKVVPASSSPTPAAQKKPAYSSMQRREAQRKLDKGAVGPEARKLQKISGTGVTTGKTIVQKARPMAKRPIGMGRDK